MSIIVKPPVLGNGIGGNNKGFPPANCTIINHTVNDKSVWVKWSDPEDTSLGDVLISQWKGTILVRNDNHYPKSIKDGIIVCDNIIKNQYKEVWFEDTGLVNEHTYYYRFFTYSIENVYNTESNINTIFKETPMEFSPILSNNSWSAISKAAESGVANTIWNIGDEISVPLSGYDRDVIYLQIWDFNHFDKSDGSGKAGIVFGCKYLASDNIVFSNQSGGWKYSNIRNKTLKSLYEAMDQSLQSVIKEVIVKYRPYINYGFYDHFEEVNDKIFLPSITEVGLSCPGYSNCNEGPTFPIFTDNASRIRKYLNSHENAGYFWWTRSLLYGSKGVNYSYDYFYYVDDTGDISYDSYSSANPACPCFNI